jgi:hypothetical protein
MTLVSYSIIPTAISRASQGCTYHDHSAPNTVFATSPQMVTFAEPTILIPAKVFIKFVPLPPLIIQINSTYIYNSLQSDPQNCIYGLFYLHYPLRQLLQSRPSCTPARVFIKFVRLPPLIIQINSTYIYNSLQSNLQNCIHGLFYLHYPLGQFLQSRPSCTPARVFIKFVHLPPLIIQINSTYIYNALQSDLQNCIYGLFYLHYPLGQFLQSRPSCTPAKVFIKFVCLLPITIQINATYIYNSLPRGLPALRL